MRRYEAILNEFVELNKTGTPLPSHRLAIAGVDCFTPQEIKKIRLEANMTQWMFAQVIGVSQKSVEAWEGGRSKPDGAARRMLGLMKKDPKFADVNGIVTR